jgi:hypothetical protein
MKGFPNKGSDPAEDDYQLVVLAGCDTGPCPKVGHRRARPGFAIVQGSRVPGGERPALGHIPNHEDVVEVPEEVLLQYARRMVAEGRI